MSTKPLVHPLARLLASLTRLYAPHGSLCSHALLGSLSCIWTRGKECCLMSHFQAVLNHGALLSNPCRVFFPCVPPSLVICHSLGPVEVAIVCGIMLVAALLSLLITVVNKSHWLCCCCCCCCKSRHYCHKGRGRTPLPQGAASAAVVHAHHLNGNANNNNNSLSSSIASSSNQR